MAQDLGTEWKQAPVLNIWQFAPASHNSGARHLIDEHEVLLSLSAMEFRQIMLVLQNNIDDISCLISQSLDLTRSLDTEEAPTRMELTSFVLSIVDDNAETGTRVSMPRQKTATCRQSSCGCAGSASSAAWKISFPMPASTEAAPG